MPASDDDSYFLQDDQDAAVDTSTSSVRSGLVPYEDDDEDDAAQTASPSMTREGVTPLDASVMQLGEKRRREAEEDEDGLDRLAAKRKQASPAGEMEGGFVREEGAGEREEARPPKKMAVNLSSQSGKKSR